MSYKNFTASDEFGGDPERTICWSDIQRNAGRIQVERGHRCVRPKPSTNACNNSR